MNARILKPAFFIIPFMVFGMTVTMGQYSTVDETIEFINSKLSHSYVQRIDQEGKVIINAPSEMITFNITEASFNYNGLNHDNRVRVFCDFCIEYYKNKRLENTSNRQSFLCGSESDAKAAIDAFNHLKTIYSENKTSLKPVDKKLNVNDSTLGYSTVNGAIDLINENLTYSMILRINEQGEMLINSPDKTYNVDLGKAEFCLNDLNDAPKVRIYGNFCIEQLDGPGEGELISRQSFQADSRTKANQAIMALYYIKAEYSSLDVNSIPTLKNVSRKETNHYSTMAEAIDYINDRLKYSLILDVTDQGEVLVNSPDHIFRFNLRDVTIEESKEKSRYEFGPVVVIRTGDISGILFECDECIRRYDDPYSYDILDDQDFQCIHESDVKDTHQAWIFLQKQFEK